MKALNRGGTLSMAPVLIGVAVDNEAVTHQRLDLGTHTLFVGELVDAGIKDDTARAASMSDTRMKYGGVKRH